jgi:DNA polymerase IV (DinB-like DNA polymerase)
LHVDLDAFYTSVEARENPKLAGHPVIVGADPKGGKGRGVVSTCSYEARRFGVGSGQPISRAYKLCPQAVFLRPNLTLYARISVLVMRRLREFADKFEQVGMDEAFMDVTSKVNELGSIENLSMAIKKVLREKEGLTCSIGVARNKSIAKIASGIAKPDALTVVPFDRPKEWLAPLPVTAISGIGRKTERALASLGITTIGELASIPGKRLFEHFGKVGVWMWGIANVLENAPVEESYVMKSVGAEHTFDYDTDDLEAVKGVLKALVDSVHQRLMEEKMTYRTVSIKIRFHTFTTHTRARSYKENTSSRDLIRDGALGLLAEFARDKRKIRLIGIRVSNLKPVAKDQSDLGRFA